MEMVRRLEVANAQRTKREAWRAAGKRCSRCTCSLLYREVREYEADHVWCGRCKVVRNG